MCSFSALKKPYIHAQSQLQVSSRLQQIIQCLPWLLDHLGDPVKIFLCAGEGVLRGQYGGGQRGQEEETVALVQSQLL